MAVSQLSCRGRHTGASAAEWAPNCSERMVNSSGYIHLSLCHSVDRYKNRKERNGIGSSSNCTTVPIRIWIESGATRRAKDATTLAVTLSCLLRLPAPAPPSLLLRQNKIRLQGGRQSPGGRVRESKKWGGSFPLFKRSSCCRGLLVSVRGQPALSSREAATRGPCRSSFRSRRGGWPSWRVEEPPPRSCSRRAARCRRPRQRGPSSRRIRREEGFGRALGERESEGSRRQPP
jgi:hypothetical protein